MTSRRRSILSLAVSVAMASIIAGCEFSGEVPEPPGEHTPTAATADAGGSAATNTPSPAFGVGDQLLGPFRRGSVPAPGELVAAAAGQCLATPTPPTVAEIGDRRVVVSDLRGGGRVLLVFADAEAAVGCRVEVGEDGSMRASYFRVATPEPAPLAEDDLALGTLDYTDDPGGPLVIAAGQVGDRAVHVRAGFDDDTYTTATITNGWWLMWWPGQARPASITADDNKNVVITSVKVP